METYHFVKATGKVYKTSNGVNKHIKESGHGRHVTSVIVNSKNSKITSVKTGVYGKKSKKTKK